MVSAAISACGGAQQWQAWTVAFGKLPLFPSPFKAAVYLIHSMEIQLLVPDTIAWNAAITACKKGSQWQVQLLLKTFIAD